MSENAGAHPIPENPRHDESGLPLEPESRHVDSAVEGQYTDGEYDVEPGEDDAAVAPAVVEEPVRRADTAAPVRAPGQYTDGEYDTAPEE
jgi:hypothetical protein